MRNAPALLSDAGGPFLGPSKTVLARPLSRGPLPAVQRADASLAVLDVTEFFAEASGGIRTYLLEKARYARASPGVRHVLVVPGERDRVTEIDGARCYELRGPRIPRQHPYRFMLATQSNARIIEHERPDIVEVGSALLVPWIVGRVTRRHRLPMVGFHHSHVPRLLQAARSRRLGRLASAASWRYMVALSRQFERTIVASRFLADELTDAGIGRVVHIPLGVDLAQFHPGRRVRAAETRRLLGLPAGPLAVFAGRLAVEKELDVLIDAWPAVERAIGAHLLIVGHGPQAERLKARALPRAISFRPFIRDRDRLADLLASADVFVAPGRYETFGLAALEALASGTPVVTADEGGVAEQVADSGAGLAFASGEPSALATTLLQVLGGDHAVLGRRGREFAEREHAWPVVFGRLFALYREVIAEYHA